MLWREVPQYDGVVACEGSQFKSKFANALTTMMIGSLGIAAAQNKLSVSYGAEAGYMDPLIAKMVARYCKDSFVITRNPESQTVLGKLGVSTELGTDTAWTFEPHPNEFGNDLLRKHGWDGSTPVLVVCPINPFWWPVKASVAKYAAKLMTGAYQESHYRKFYFHNSGPEVERKYDYYLTAIANAVDRFRKENRVFPFWLRLRCSTRGLARRCRTNLEEASRFFVRRLRYVSIGQPAALLPSDGFVALSRHRDVYAIAGRVGGRDDGRAHPQPDERARPSGFAADG